MRSKLFFIALTVLFSQYATAGAHSERTPEAEARAKSESCIKCHADQEVLLKGTGADSIAETIKSIRAGDTAHMPEIGNPSDEEITEIAAWLDRGPL
jgi:cytochrome c553